jgi:sarcosine dehydrogenase
MFNACGFNSMGMMLGGGIGREVATWIAEGSPSIDMFAFDVSRFHKDSVSDAKWVKDRTHESYAKTYAIVFPHDEALSGRLSRKSPIHEELRKQGCVFQARHGFERPGWFVSAKTATEVGDARGKQEPGPYDYYGAYDNGGAWRLGEKGDGEAYSADASIPAQAGNTYLELVEKELTFYRPHNMEEVLLTHSNTHIHIQTHSHAHTHMHD